jgi:nucleotide-binding universal stress UspA family protein
MRLWSELNTRGEEMTKLECESHHRTVVGIDGSECSVAALRWAAQQAHLTGSSLEVVMSWEWPNSYGFGYVIPDNFDPESDAHKMLDDAVEKIRGAFPDVKVQPVVVEGHPALTLVEAAREADILVVGSRGHGEFSGMLLGSVSEYCSHHASCPVTIVR